MKRLLTISILFISLIALPASTFAETLKCVYKGTIAGKNVRVELYLYGPNESVHGSYYYYNNKGEKISKKLTLKGERTYAYYIHEFFTLEETYNGKYCGSWAIERIGDEVTGTFTNPKGKEYDIKLHQVN